VGLKLSAGPNRRVWLEWRPWYRLCYSEALDISDDGNIIVGRGKTPSGKEAFVWTSAAEWSDWETSQMAASTASLVVFQVTGLSLWDGATLNLAMRLSVGPNRRVWLEWETFQRGPYGSWAEDVRPMGIRLWG